MLKNLLLILFAISQMILKHQNELSQKEPWEGWGKRSVQILKNLTYFILTILDAPGIPAQWVASRITGKNNNGTRCFMTPR